MLLVLVWQLPNVHLEDLDPNWSRWSIVWLLAAVAAKFGAFALSTLRWRTVLATMAEPPPFREMFSHFLSGQFVSMVLPTAFGGDVVRVARLGKDIESNPIAFASVSIDRMTGWLVLPMICLTTFAVQPSFFSLGNATTVALTTSIVTMVFLVLVLVIGANRAFSRDLSTVSGWRRFLVAAHLGLDGLRRHPRQAVEVILVGVAFQSLQCFSVWLAARAIGADAIGLGAVFAFFPPTAILQNLPVGVGGLGVRESAFVLFFGAVGAEQGISITLGLMFYLLTLGTSALGAPSFIFGSHAEREYRQQEARERNAPTSADGAERA